MADVIPFKGPESSANDDTPVRHISGPVKCIACKHEWTGVYPVGESSITLECPSCGLCKGESKYTLSVHPGASRYICPVPGCECELFVLQPTGIFCSRCGEQSFPFDDPQGAA